MKQYRIVKRNSHKFEPQVKGKFWGWNVFKKYLRYSSITKYLSTLEEAERFIHDDFDMYHSEKYPRTVMTITKGVFGDKK